jgi:hypothetical protein
MVTMVADFMARGVCLLQYLAKPANPASDHEEGSQDSLARQQLQ